MRSLPPDSALAQRLALVDVMAAMVRGIDIIRGHIVGLDKHLAGDIHRCSFCQRQHTAAEVKAVMHGPGVSICDMCLSDGNLLLCGVTT